MDKRESAKKILVNYFRFLYQQVGAEFGPDNKIEIELVIDWIIEAVQEEAKENKPD
jgi:hypothetical protein